MTTGSSAGDGRRETIRLRLAAIRVRLAELRALRREARGSSGERLTSAECHVAASRAAAAQAIAASARASRMSAEAHERAALHHERAAASGSGDKDEHERQAAAHRVAAEALRSRPVRSQAPAARRAGRPLLVSPAAVRAQMTLTWRELAAATRRQAVDRARELGLLNG